MSELDLNAIHAKYPDSESVMATGDNALIAAWFRVEADRLARALLNYNPKATRTITVASHVKNVVDNLRATDPRLKDVADWRIDAAHRHYSVSEDFGDDLKVFEWLPDETEEKAWDYIQHVQISDMWRTIRELEAYNAQLAKEKRELTVKLGAALSRDNESIRRSYD